VPRGLPFAAVAGGRRSTKTDHFRGGVHRLCRGKADPRGRCPPVGPARAPSASACEPYRELIDDALVHGRNAVAIYQDLLDDHGFTARCTSVRWFVAKLRGGTTPEARLVIATRAGGARLITARARGALV
jgi:hypothetical protein